VHCFPASQGDVSEHSEHLCALHTVAACPPFTQLAHSSSSVHSAGHSARHIPSTQASVDWHALVFSGVQATHFESAVSQTWCIGSQGRQSLSSTQVMSGSPRSSVGQVAPCAMQSP
jgi:hypothetical protein